MTIYLAFVILSALALWSLIYARGPWGVKLALICTVPFFGVVVWHTLEGYKGWPAAVTPPADAVFLARAVDEPDYIYLWMVPAGSDRPRAYRIPYSPDVHEQVEGAATAAGQGRRIGLRRNRGRYVAYELPSTLPSKESP